MASEGPTLRSELRRGFNTYNLSVAAATAVALGLACGLATCGGWLPDLTGSGYVHQGLVVAAGLFALITLLHAGAHAYFGWRFEQGLASYAKGDHARARRLLAPVARRGMDHYDVDGVARQAWHQVQASGRA